jgi:hypothetical protein
MVAETNDLLPRKFDHLKQLKPLKRTLIKRHAIAIMLASHGLHKQFQAILELPTSLALAYFAESEVFNTDLLYRHVRHFPRHYRVPPLVATWIANDVSFRMSESRKSVQERGQIFDERGAAAVLISAAMAGADLSYCCFTSLEASPSQMDQFLHSSPRETLQGFKGHTLAHAFCLDADFVSKKLPVLMRRGIDINQISYGTNAGTALHIILADENEDQALEVLRSPFTQGKIDPRAYDGELKTITMIAAKVRAEKVLLALADLYPKKLGLDMQDDQGRTGMHDCFALGLCDAACRYMELGARIDIKDKIRGLTAVDCLDLSREETSAILRSIEIHPDRDANAKYNAILGCKKGFRNVLIDGKAQLCVAENFTEGLYAAAFAQFGNDGLTLCREQKDRLCGVALIDKVLAQREQLKTVYESGHLYPRQRGDILTQTRRSFLRPALRARL